MQAFNSIIPPVWLTLPICVNGGGIDTNKKVNPRKKNIMMKNVKLDFIVHRQIQFMKIHHFRR